MANSLLALPYPRTLFRPRDGGLRKIVAVEPAQRGADVSLGEAQFDALLLEYFGKVFQLFQIRRLVRRFVRPIVFADERHVEVRPPPGLIRRVGGGGGEARMLLLLLLELSMMMVWEGLLTGFVALAAVSYHCFRRVRGGMRTSDGLFFPFSIRL